MSTIVNARYLLLQATVPRLLAPVNATILLTSTASAFHVTAGGANTPSSITFTAKLVAMEGNVTFSATGGTLTSISGNTCVLTFASMSSPTATVTATITYRGTLFTATCFITQVTDGAAGTNGTNGTNGTRGTVTIAASGYSSWSDASAVAELSSAGYGSPVNRDIVTLYDATNSVTKFYQSGTWYVLTAYVNGNMLVSGTLSASQIYSGTFTGLTFQTAASGDRVVIDSTSNSLKVYSGSTVVTEIGGSSGSTVYVPSLTTLSPAIFATATTGSSIPTIYGYNGSSGAGVSGFSSGGVGGTFQSNGTSPALYAKNTVSGHGARIQGGAGSVTASALIALSDGTSRTFYNETGSFGPFTGSHDAAISKDAVVEVGDIVVDAECLARAGVNNTFFRVERSSVPNQKSASGVVNVRLSMTGLAIPASFIDMVATEAYSIAHPDLPATPIAVSEWADVQATYDFLGMNALGEGQINVCGEGGDIAAGDYIVTSSIAGKGMKQADDILRSITVARAREAVTFSSPSEIKQIACFYVSG